MANMKAKREMRLNELGIKNLTEIILQALYEEDVTRIDVDFMLHDIAKALCAYVTSSIENRMFANRLNEYMKTVTGESVTRFRVGDQTYPYDEFYIAPIEVKCRIINEFIQVTIDKIQEMHQEYESMYHVIHSSLFHAFGESSSLDEEV